MLQRGSLWLLIASSWLVMFEPAPYEVLFFITLMLFLPHGLSVGRQVIPLIIFLFLYNLGGVFSMLPRLESAYEAIEGQTDVMFTAVSCYMAVTALFFAFSCAKQPMKVMSVVRSGYLIAGTFAAVFGIVGYLGLAGGEELFTLGGRARSTFKDPNVFGAFVILPAVYLVHGLMTGQQRWKLLAVAALVVIIAGNFLAFSRGAWLALFASVVTAMGLTFLVTPSLQLRSRIVLLAIAGAIGLVGLLVFALSFHEVGAMFEERAKLVQSYDSGETGRFARMVNSIPVVLQAPNGIGMLPFAMQFGEDPHNVYLNAFVSYGWLGGISYLLLIIATLVAGWRAVFTRSPWQHHAIVVCSVMFVSILQGLQIDTDHWRHFYLQLGLVWGLFAATEIYRSGRLADDVIRQAVAPAAPTSARGETDDFRSPANLRRLIASEAGK